MLRTNGTGTSPHSTSNLCCEQRRGAAPLTLLTAALALILGACSPTSEQTPSDATLLSQSSQLAIAPRWSLPASLASARNGHTATLLPTGKLLVVGGAGSSGTLASAELLDLATGTWAAAGSLFEARKNHTATLLPSGKVLVAGGETSSGSLASAELYDPATGSWTSAGSLFEARKNHTATLLPSGEVLVVGGSGSTSALTSAELYDPATDTWTSAGSLSQARASFTATLLPSGKVLVVGGAGPGSPTSVELYDVATDSWSSTDSLSQARWNHVAMLLPSGKVLVAGGSGSNGVLNSAELYDPTTGTWASTGSLGQARTDTTATLLTSGKVLMVGGSGTSDALVSAELYDPATGSWAATLSPFLARGNHTATLLPSGKVLVVGGLDSSGPLASTELYNPSAGSWASTASLAPGHSHTATLLPSGKVLVTSGLSDSGYVLVVSVKEYDPVSDSWAPTSPLGQGRYSHTATLLPSGKVLVAGGSTFSSALSSAELYDPVSRSWTPTGPLTQDRHSHTATLLPSGKVLVVGGTGTSSFLASAELYDPATSTWAATGSLAQGRYSHTATLLPSGKVLVAGGYANGALASAELYDPATGTWSATGSLAQVRDMHTATLLPSGKVLVAGGSGTGYYMATAEVYDPATGSWTATGSLIYGRFAHTATLLPSGKVLVANGAESSSYKPTSELYDPVTGSWMPTTPPARARYSHTATLLPSGKVFVTGGDSSDFACEVYDDTGAHPSWRPDIVSVSTSALLAPGSVFTVNGSLFRGLSEASGGGSRSSPTDFPFLTLLDLARGRQRVLPAQDFSSAHVTVSVPQLPPGHYLLSITVNGLTSSTVLAIAAALDTTPPTVTLTSPSASATLVGTVTLAATALDNFDVSGVEFYDGATLLGTDTAPPYSLSWNTKTTANGPHLLTVKAIDSVGLSATSNGVSVTVNNDEVPPTVALASPAAGATVLGTLTLTATATDNVAVTRVEFYDGDTRLGTDTFAPYTCSWNTRMGPNGEHTLTAKAFDAQGNIGITTVTVTVDNDLTPPTVALTTPAEGETVSGTLVLSATASDNKAVTRVAFFVGTTQVGSDTSAPYSFSYNTRLLTNGAKVLTAKAYDAANNVGTSTAVNVTFDNDFIPPTVTLTAPGEGETLSGTVTFTATASDASGISKVAFFVGTTQVGTDTSAPFSFTYNTRSLTNGSKVLTAKAYDSLNNVATSAAVSVILDNDFNPPVTALTSPTGGSTLSGMVQLDATASDDRGTVTKVDFYRGSVLLGTVTSAPYSWTWNTTTATVGTHTLKTRAWDSAGNSAYSTNVTVTVTR